MVQAPVRLYHLGRRNAGTFLQPINVLRVHSPQHPTFIEQSQEPMSWGGLRAAFAILGGVQVARESVERPRVVQELLQIE